MAIPFLLSGKGRKWTGDTSGNVKNTCNKKERKKEMSNNAIHQIVIASFNRMGWIEVGTEGEKRNRIFGKERGGDKGVTEINVEHFY